MRTRSNPFPKDRKILDKEMDVVAKCGKDKGVDTAIVLNNDLVHTSNLFLAILKQWESQGLYLYFRLTYSPALKIIERELNFKKNSIHNKKIEDKHDLSKVFRHNIYPNKTLINITSSNINLTLIYLDRERQNT